MRSLVIHLLQFYVVVFAEDYTISSLKLANISGSNNGQECDIIRLLDNVFVKCSSLSLTTVPNLPKTSTFISLDHNNISNITDLPFLGMKHLQSLNLSYNPLKFISQNLFKGLSQLQRIYFLHCLLYFQADLNYEYLLSDVINLKEFALSFYGSHSHSIQCKNVSSYRYFTILKRSVALEIDATVFASLLVSDDNSTVAITRKLILWNDDEGCLIRIFKQQMFSAFLALEELTIFNRISGDLFLVYIDEYTFRQLNQLHVLTISNVDSVSCNEYQESLDIKKYSWTIDLFMHNISASASRLNNLIELRIEGFSCPPKRVYLNCSFAISQLSRSKSLTKLSLNKNSISLMYCLSFDKEVFSLPESLSALELRENCLGAQDIFNLLTFFTRLTYIDARIQNRCGNIFRQDNGYFNTSERIVPAPVNNPKTLIESELQEVYFSHCQEAFNYWFEYHTDNSFNHLRLMEFSWLKDFRGMSLKIPAEFLDRRPNLLHLDLSGSKVENIDARTFKNTSTLKTLYLSSNSLAKMGSNLSSVLKEIQPLEELSLANNGITDLTEDVFRSMNLLTTLDLSGNLLSTFTPSLKHLGNLKLLNISKNKLDQLSPTNQKDLDKIKQTSDVVVDISGNRFVCTCHTLAFLKWIVSTHVTLHNRNTFSCRTTTNRKVSMDNLKHEIKSLESACVSNTVLAIVCSISAAFCISCLVCALTYRFRWRLRYLYYMAKLRVSKSQDKYERIYDYDAFISYASDDFSVARSGCMENLESAKGLRLFIHERDFTPGEAIAYNISVGIHSSKMTIFFLSDSFLSSEWCLYEFNIARMESLYSKRTVMLIVLLESTVVDQLPVDILDVIRSVTYLEYPDHGDEDDVSVFWNKLADCIRGQ